jgi:transposase/SAM-dependent methyltransferase
MKVYNTFMKQPANLEAELRRLYCDENLSDKQIAPSYGVSAFTIWKWRKTLGIEGINPQQRKYKNNPEIPLTARQRSILFGSLLGDMSVKASPSQRTIFSVTHCDDQKDFLFWLYDEFKNICKPPRSELSHEKYKMHILVSPARTDLLEIRHRIYTPEKTVSQWWLDQIDDLGLAVWYMDDGHYKYKNGGKAAFTFATNSFSEEQHFLLKQWMQSRFGVQTVIEPRAMGDGFQYNLVVADESADSFLGIIRQHLLPSMTYKFDSSAMVQAMAAAIAKDGITKELLQDLYVRQGLTQTQIGEALGKHKSTIIRYMKVHGIGARGLADAQLHGKNSRTSRRHDGTFGDAELSAADLDLAKEIFTKLRASGFPYQEVPPDEKCIGSIDRLCAYPVESLRGTDGVWNYSNSGMHMVTPFFPQTMGMKSQGSLSPIEIFNDDEMLLDCIRRTMRYARKHSVAAIRSGLKTYRANRAVTVFPPIWAKSGLAASKAPNGASVLDFCCGFGGRLVGSYAYGASRYVGIDPLQSNVSSHQQILAPITKHSNLAQRSFSAEFHCGKAEDVLPSLTERFDIVMTSPPYYDKEIYDDGDAQCYLRWRDYEAWLNEWLKPVLLMAKGCLKPNGRMVIFASNTQAYPVGDDCCRLLSAVFGATPEMVNFLVPSLEYNRQATSRKTEVAWISP